MKKTFVIILPAVRREILVSDRMPHIGELLSSRHVGLFDAEPCDGLPCAPYSLQEAMWLLDRPAQWFASMVRRGELKAFRKTGEIVFETRGLSRLVNEGLASEPAEDWCARVETVEPASGDVDAVIHTRPLPAEARWEDSRQLRLSLAID